MRHLNVLVFIILARLDCQAQNTFELLNPNYSKKEIISSIKFENPHATQRDVVRIDHMGEGMFELNALFFSNEAIEYGPMPMVSILLDRIALDAILTYISKYDSNIEDLPSRTYGVFRVTYSRNGEVYQYYTGTLSEAITYFRGMEKSLQQADVPDLVLTQFGSFLRGKGLKYYDEVSGKYFWNY